MSFGSLPVGHSSTIDMNEVLVKYPTMNRPYDDFMSAVSNIGSDDAYGWCYLNNQDMSTILDELERTRNGDTIESVDPLGVAAAWKRLAAAMWSATGLSLGAIYAGEAEDSYADCSDEWVFYVENAYDKVPTPEARRSGLTFTPKYWNIYG